MRLFMILLVAATFGGCVASNGDEGMIILKNVAPADTCTFTAAENEPFVAEGTLDTAYNGFYLFVAQLKSRITATAGTEDQKTILIKGANIDVSFPNSTVFSAAELATLRSSGATHFRQLFSAPLLPNGGITDVGFIIIPSALSSAVFAKLSATMPSVLAVATFTVDGDMAGGTVTSQKFDYPVNLTTGLVIDAGPCPLPMGTTVRKGNPCNLDQDASVDCCRLPNNTLRCPAS
jgi:hypothetical protein